MKGPCRYKRQKNRHKNGNWGVVVVVVSAVVVCMFVSMDWAMMDGSVM